MLYGVSVGVIFLEKNEIGCQVLLTCCWRTAPTAVSEASVMRQEGTSGVGYERSEALARASFVALKEARAASFQERA